MEPIGSQHCGKSKEELSNITLLSNSCKQVKISATGILLFYCTCVRPIIEYGTQVFYHALPNYLSDAIKRVQDRVLSIIYPSFRYIDSLIHSNLLAHHTRQKEACLKLFKRIEDHKLHCLLPLRTVEHHWSRKQRKFTVPSVNTKRFLNPYVTSTANEINRSYMSLVIVTCNS